MMAVYGPETVVPVYTVLASIGLGLTGLRLWIRISHSRISLSLDDLFILLGVALVSAYTAIQYYYAIHGSINAVLFKEDDVERAFIAAQQLHWTSTLIEKPAFGFVKLSILYFYNRIFGVCPAFRRTNNVLIAVIATWTVVFFIADVFICGAHPALQWALDQAVALAQCGDVGALLLAYAVTSVGTNIVVLVRSVFYMRQLRMPRRKKIATGFVLFLGVMYVNSPFILVQLEPQLAGYRHSGEE